MISTRVTLGSAHLVSCTTSCPGTLIKYFKGWSENYASATSHAQLHLVLTGQQTRNHLCKSAWSTLSTLRVMMASCLVGRVLRWC